MKAAERSISRCRSRAQGATAHASLLTLQLQRRMLFRHRPPAHITSQPHANKHHRPQTMSHLEFKEIAALINKSRTTAINTTPLKDGDTWDIYRGNYKIHQSVTPFHILYLGANSTTESIHEAYKQSRYLVGLQVVYAASLDARHPTHLAVFKEPTKRYRARDYLASFIASELSSYTDRLTDQDPRHFIAPRVGTSKLPNPISTFLSDPTGSIGLEPGALGIVLADPGQGKTGVDPIMSIT